LIVDDHPNTAAMLARVLGKFEIPVEVLTACSGEEALELTNGKLVDILITDFHDVRHEWTGFNRKI
jgi:CheY-like chemotaxis protein